MQKEDLKMLDERIYICKNCGNGDLDINNALKRPPKCSFCNNEWYCTEKTEDEWRLIYKSEHPDDEMRNFTTAMLCEYIRIKLTNEGIIHPNEIAVNARIEKNKRLNNNYRSAPKCPKCGSIMFHSEKRGFSTGRAVAAGALTGFLDVAAVAGAVGKDKMVNVCDRCGHKWK